MKRIAILLYGLGCYGIFLVVLVYAIGFVGGFGVPTTLDGPRRSPVFEGIAVNALLLLAFAVQHSVMARPGFKRWWGQWIHPAAERSTYVLCTNLTLGLLFWQWRPLGGVVWEIQQPIGRAILWTLFGTGWMMVLITTFLINHFDLFGLRQVWFNFRRMPLTPLAFRTPGPYRVVRHPLYVGWLTAFWCTPQMTASHLLFALGTTAYILLAIRFEERDLTRHHPEYAVYRERVPMLIPRILMHPMGSRPTANRPGRAKLLLSRPCSCENSRDAWTQD